MEKIKVLTYNIDGLPEKLDLNDLPFILKPIAWIYKLIKKNTIIQINDNQNSDKRIRYIGEYIKNSNFDIVAVQEDFNFHNELTKDLIDKYKIGTYKGGFDIKNIFSCISWLPRPRFKSDGLNLFAKIGKVFISSEEIVPWKKSYGYINHANDLLTHKGFRKYILNIGYTYNIDVYILHMDADFYHPENCPDVSGDIEARKSQFNQLVNWIISDYKSGNKNPIIIMGDTNSSHNYKWDIKNIEMELMHPINHENGLHIEEAIPNNFLDVDRIFFINNDTSNYNIELDTCYYEDNYNDELKEQLSDHKALVATFNIKDK